MNIFLIALLIGALLIMVYQRELLVNEREQKLLYQDYWRKAESSLTVVLHAWKVFYKDKLYRKMERAYHASLKRGYKVAGRGREISVRESVAWGFTDLYIRRLDNAAWRKKEPDRAPKHVGIKLLRRRMGIARSLHKNVEKPVCLA